MFRLRLLSINIMGKCVFAAFCRCIAGRMDFPPPRRQECLCQDRKKVEMAQAQRVVQGTKEQRKGHFLADKDRFCNYCVVRGVGFCGMVPNDDMACLSERSRAFTLDRRKTLFHQGDETQNVYIVTGGTLRLYQMLADGRRQVIGFALPGDLLGSPLVDHNDYSVDALDAVYLCRFPRQEFMQFLNQRSHLIVALLNVTHDELDRAREQIALISQKNAERKMAQFLVTFRGCQMRPDGQTAVLPVRIPQADIADFLGLTIETVNRMLARLMREKTILIADSGIELLDLPRLRMLAENWDNPAMADTGVGHVTSGHVTSTVGHVTSTDRPTKTATRDRV